MKAEAIRKILEAAPGLSVSQSTPHAPLIWDIDGVDFTQGLTTAEYSRYSAHQVKSFLDARNQDRTPGKDLFYRQIGAKLFSTHNGYSHPRSIKADAMGEIITATHTTYYRGQFKGRISTRHSYWLYISMTRELIKISDRLLKNVPSPSAVIADMVRKAIRS